MSIRIEIELEESEIQQLEQQAKQAGQTLTDWVKHLVKSQAIPSPTYRLGEFEIVPIPIGTNRYRYKILRQGVEYYPDPMSIVGCFSSGLGDLSAEHDRYLAEAYEQ